MSNPMIAISNRLTWLLKKGKAIREGQGWAMLCRRTILYVLRPIFWRRTFILYARDIGDDPELNEADFNPNIENWSLKNVSSHEEAESLEAEGFMFRYWPTFDNKKLTYYSKLLDEGATALCGFAGHELAFILWAIPSTEAMRKVTYYRPKVNYASGERYAQGPWANPKYRRKKLLTYNIYFNYDPFLRANGGKVSIGVLGEHKRSLRKIIESVGYKPYAKAKVTRFLWWKFWEGEKSLDSSNHEGS